MRVVRDSGRAVESELSAYHLAVAHVPLVVAYGTPFAQVQDFHVACVKKTKLMIIENWGVGG